MSVDTLENRSLQIFKMKNRRGYAAICDECVTEGDTRQEAYDRMVKAIKRVQNKPKKD